MITRSDGIQINSNEGGNPKALGPLELCSRYTVNPIRLGVAQLVLLCHGFEEIFVQSDITWEARGS